MPLPAKSRAPLPGVDKQYVREDPSGVRIGIALSGGGIRSAAFNLGALQALQERGLLSRAEYVTAVSGGNYVASALTISASRAGATDVPAPWSHGSPEERHLRQHTDYLAPGFVGRVWIVLSVVYGFVLNYLPFLLGAFLIGRVCGWLVHANDLQLSDLHLRGLAAPPSPVMGGLLVLLAALLSGAVTLVAFRRLADGHRAEPAEYGSSWSEGLAGVLVAAAGLTVVAMTLPVLAVRYAAASRWLLHGAGAGASSLDSPGWRIGVAVLWLTGALAAAGVALVLSRRLRAHRMMLVLSSLAGAGLLLVPLLSSLEFSARHGICHRGEVLGAAAAGVTMLVMAVTVHNRRYSLHLLYRERLNAAFALHRTHDPRRGTVAEPIPFSERLTFSQIGRAAVATGMPKLVVCCAVNLTTDVVPYGRFADSFTFEHDVSGCPLLDYHATSRFESHHGPAGSTLTLPSIMAVSGAALSPLMGRFTYPPVRFLMALTNVRLGVWVPNPLHRSWSGPPPDTAASGWRRLRKWVVDGWREPGAFYVLLEALGVLGCKHRFIYLTDGGHWENLGLVELLRRRCTHLLCFDASSDRTGGGQDLGRAIALARSELGADVDIDPGPLMGHDGRAPERQAVRGTVRYPQSDGEARLVYAKAVLTPSASWDLLSFHRRDALFPNHPTSQQIFTDEQFEAYRSLGHAAGLEAADLLNVAPALLDGTRADGPAEALSQTRYQQPISVLDDHED